MTEKYSFTKEIGDIYRLKIPFENIYTSSFLIKTDIGAVLVDCGSSGEDVDRYLIPALAEAGYSLGDIKMLLLTHGHKDHAGGLERILTLAPNIEVVREARELCDGVETYPMAGHTADSIGVLDSRCGALISGDGLQGAAVGRFRLSVKERKEYLETLERVRRDGRISALLFSHQYEPWNSGRIVGRRAVPEALDKCLEIIKGEKK